ARDGLVELFGKLSKDPEWLAFLNKAGLKPTFLTGDKLRSFLENFETVHKDIMREQGWIK
ncbi:MAG: hypothetical protein ACE5IA_08275, partial [Dehalococcoidia bacterium]